MQGKEFGVISDELLAEQLKLQAPKHVSDYNDESGVTDADVLSLRLDFHSILSINNLISFTNLTKLQLDNNLIEKIENLEMLINLTWLDLSYNNIDKIEGLDTLIKLTDLSLQHNQISNIEGLDNLKDLDVLSLGDNLLESLEEAPVIYLRRFDNLRSVSLSGNPLASDPKYSEYLVAVVPQLRYMDWRRITDEMRVSAETTYANMIETIKIKESELKQKETKIQKEKELTEKYAAASVPSMYNDIFYAELFDHPPELTLLDVIPGIEDAKISFKDTVLDITTVIGSKGLEIAHERKTEREEVAEAIRTMIQSTAEACAKSVEAYVEIKNKDITAAQSIGGALGAAKLEGLGDLIDDKRIELMDLEVDLSNRISEVVASFSRNTQEILEKGMAINSEQMSLLREAEEKFTEAMTSAASSFYDQYSRGMNEDNIEVSDELHMLMRDKETVLNVIINMHDKHMLTMDGKEDALTKLPLKELESFVQTLEDSEHSRHRERIGEIRSFVDFQNSDIENFDMNPM